MAARRSLESQIRNLKLNSTKDVQISVGGEIFTLDAELLASKSSKMDTWLKNNNKDNICTLIQDTPSDIETIELVARFCHGYSINLLPENILQVITLSHYLGMTENHSENNLFNKALNFLEFQVLSSWNKTLRALKAHEKVLLQAMNLGVLDNCVESLICKATDNPNLLGEPIWNSGSNDGSKNTNTNTNTKQNVNRRLFVSDGHCEDLISLSLILYEPIIRAMIVREIPLEYVSASIYKYAKKWVVSKIDQFDDTSTGCSRSFQKEAIEAVERMLPEERGSLLPCTLLCEMLYCAITLDSSVVCRNGFEERIGKQLDQATIKDLYIPFQGYDTDCVKRILKCFYNNYNAANKTGLIAVFELIVGFLVEVASDIDLKINSFVSIAELSIAASLGVQRNHDGIYEAVDIYLEKHSYIPMSEREEVCKVIDCNKLSQGVLEHAAVNPKLPLRLVMQVLFVGQLQLRDKIGKEIQGIDIEGGEDEEDVESGLRAEMEKMNNKVLELEKECNMMKREIYIANCKKGQVGKSSVWKEMKRKFGCVSSSKNDCNCHVKKKKVHPNRN